MEDGAWHKADQLRSIQRDTGSARHLGDLVSDACRTVTHGVEQVARHLNLPSRVEAQSSNVRGPDRSRYALGQRDVGARKPEVVRDQGGSRSYGTPTRRRVRKGWAVIGGERIEGSAPDLRQAALGAVQEAGKTELPTGPVGKRAPRSKYIGGKGHRLPTLCTKLWRLCRSWRRSWRRYWRLSWRRSWCRPAPGDVGKGYDIERSDTRMHPFVAADVDELYHQPGDAPHGLLDERPCEGEHAAVVMRITVDVEQAATRHLGDLLDDGDVTTLAHIYYALDHPSVYRGRSQSRSCAWSAQLIAARARATRR